MALNSNYGSNFYGSEYYGGGKDAGLSSYIHTTVEFYFVDDEQYISSDVLLEKPETKYLHTTVAFSNKKNRYLHTTIDLVYTRNRYVHSDFTLEKAEARYLHTTIVPVFGLLTQEVDEFQVIVDGRSVKFFWADSLSLTDKSYKLYESDDEGKTWSLVLETELTEHTIDDIPFAPAIADKQYRLSVASGVLISYGIVSYPAFSVEDTLEILDNGYWDTDVESNIYQMFFSIMKEAHSRAELESKLTYVDKSITKIRKDRMSDVYGKYFDQETDSATEDYKRKIWNLFLGFRNSVTFAGSYYVTKAFTNIPPRITRLAREGWIVGKSITGVDTVPLSTPTALYGLSFEIHLPPKTAGTVDVVTDNANFTASADEYFIESTDFYKDHYLVFRTGNNVYKSKKILGFTPTSSTAGVFVTETFPDDILATDTFFVSSVSTATVEQYIKRNISAHSFLIFRYFSNYVTENFKSGFSGSLSNLELVPSRRLRIIDPDTTINDSGKSVQSVYDSGTALTRASSLSEFGGRGVACWDTIEWGDTSVDFRLYMTFSDSVHGPWSYAEARTEFIIFTGIEETIIDEFIKSGSEVVQDLVGNTYVKDVDYSIDYRTGAIRRTINSSISTGTSILVTYDLEWGQISQNQTLTLDKPYLKYRFTVDGVADAEDFEFSGFYIKSLLND